MILGLIALLAPDPHIQRTISRIADGLPVKILFYGQSITANQAWTGLVIDDLKRRFPQARIEWENRAISGFGADLLQKTVRYDVLPYYPDLVVLHDYGGEREYEALVRQLRECAVEVAIMDDFATWLPKGDEPEDKLRAYRWHDGQSKWQRAFAARVGAGFLSIRDGYKAHVAATGEGAKELTTDGTHPSPAGNALMSKLVAPQLERDLAVTAQAWNDRIRDYPLKWRGNSAEVTAVGNRFDLVVPSGAPDGATVQFRVDGKPPSEFPEAYVLTRPTIAYAGWMPMIQQFQLGTKPLIEGWTLTVTEVAADGVNFGFRVEGSQTGPDGAGSSRERFVSKSGRIVIDPADWSVGYAFRVSKQPMPVGFQCRWDVAPLGVDEFRVPASGESTVTFLRGLPTGKRTIRVSGRRRIPGAFIRGYSPPSELTSPRSAEKRQD